jgi:hypothetical protein
MAREERHEQLELRPQELRFGVVVHDGQVPQRGPRPRQRELLAEHGHDAGLEALGVVGQVEGLLHGGAARLLRLGEGQLQQRAPRVGVDLDELRAGLTATASSIGFE